MNITEKLQRLVSLRARIRIKLAALGIAKSTDTMEGLTAAIENMENWGSRWIIFPNAVYGSAANYAAQYGYKDLFEYFDYTIKGNDAWDMYD